MWIKSIYQLHHLRVFYTVQKYFKISNKINKTKLKVVFVIQNTLFINFVLKCMSEVVTNKLYIFLISERWMRMYVIKLLPIPTKKNHTFRKMTQLLEMLNNFEYFYTVFVINNRVWIFTFFSIAELIWNMSLYIAKLIFH